MRRYKEGGFTLIELMITVGVIGILASIAYPSYKAYLVRGNRAAAKAQMMDIANREQQYLLNSRSYASQNTTTSDTVFETSTTYSLPSEVNKYYTYKVVTASSPPAYTVTFTPITTSPQKSDGNLTLSSSGTKAWYCKGGSTAYDWTVERC